MDGRRRSDGDEQQQASDFTSFGIGGATPPRVKRTRGGVQGSCGRQRVGTIGALASASAMRNEEKRRHAESSLPSPFDRDEFYEQVVPRGPIAEQMSRLNRARNHIVLSSHFKHLLSVRATLKSLSV